MSPRWSTRLPTVLPPSPPAAGTLDERRAAAFDRAWPVLPERDVPTATLLAAYLAAVLDEP